MAIPSDLTNLALWLNAETVSSLDGDPVTTWNDSSGNSRNPTQAVSGSRPVLRTGLFNGRPCVRFDGTNDWLIYTAAAWLTSTDLEIFAAVRRNGPGTGGSARVVSLDAGAYDYDNTASAAAIYYAQGASAIACTRNSVDRGAVIPNTYQGAIHIVNSRWVSGTHTMHVEGTGATDNSVADASGAFGVTRLSLGALNEAGSSFLDGDIGEVIIYNRALTGPERQSIIDYLNSRYGTPLAAYPLAVRSDSPLLYWRLNEPSGTTAADLTGNGRTGTILGATYGVAGASGDSDTAMFIDATTGRVKSDVVVNLSTVTIELWVYVTAYPATAATISTFNNGDSTGFADKTVYMDPDGGARFYFYTGALANTPSPTTKVPLNQWTHLVATNDGTNGIMYQNGVEIGRIADGPTDSTYTDSRFSVGYVGSNGGGLARLNAGRDEVAVYSTALSPARILAHYQATQGPTLFQPVRIKLTGRRGA